MSQLDGSMNRKGIPHGNYGPVVLYRYRGTRVVLGVGTSFLLTLRKKTPFLICLFVLLVVCARRGCPSTGRSPPFLSDADSPSPLFAPSSGRILFRDREGQRQVGDRHGEDPIHGSKNVTVEKQINNKKQTSNASEVQR